MDDLASKLQGILSSPEGQAQLRSIAEMLGLDGSAPASGGTGQAQGSGSAGTPSGQTSGGMDLSGLLSALGKGADGPAAAGEASAASAAASGAGGPDLTGLLSALGGSKAPAGDEKTLPNIDINTIVRLQQVFQSMSVNDKNTQLLQALKPHFSERRRAKVDQAVSMMRLFSMLPALQESGLFAGL